MIWELGAHGKMLAGTKKSMGPLGISAGRSFGAEGSMSPFLIGGI